MHIRILFIFLFAAAQTACINQSTDTKIAEPNPIVNSLQHNRESCYSGGLESADTFVAMLEKNGALTNKKRKDVKKRYSHWVKNYGCYWFDYQVDSLTVKAFYVAPKSDKPNKKYPVIIYNRGGNANSGTLPMKYLIGKIFPLVNQGFIVVGSQYRGARTGKRPSPDSLRDEFGGDDVNDVLALLPIIDAMPNANSQKIGLWGTSRGAMMAYLAANRSPRFSAMVVEGGVTDMEAELTHRPDMEKVFRRWIPNYKENKSAELRKRSPLFWADELPAELPILILHGTHDKRVSTGNALQMAGKLQELHHPYQLVIYQNGSHSLREHQKEVRKTTAAWFKKYLR